MKPRALVIDQRRTVPADLLLCLDRIGCSVSVAEPGPAVLAVMNEGSFDLVFLDGPPGGQAGLDLLSDVVARQPSASVVVMSTHPTVETAVDAMRRGASDCIARPVVAAEVEAVLDRIVATWASVPGSQENDPRGLLSAIELATTSTRVGAMLDLVERSARSDAPVLLRGESGTGKGVLARLVHARSPRAGGPFVVIDCPTLSKELMASELFGHSRGSFPGAISDQPGRVEVAAGGTLFLDEVSAIPAELQPKLLRFLQDRVFVRAGESQTRWADVRIVTATNRDLERAVASGTFHEGLFYRLNVIEIAVPPLRERIEDVPLLTRSLVASLSQQMGRDAPAIAPRAAALLAAYDWPGNIRELRNVIERALLLCPGRTLEEDAFSPCRRPRGVPPRVGDDVPLRAIVRAHVQQVVARAPSLQAAARILGIDEPSLRRELPSDPGPGPRSRP